MLVQTPVLGLDAPRHGMDRQRVQNGTNDPPGEPNADEETQDQERCRLYTGGEEDDAFDTDQTDSRDRQGGEERSPADPRVETRMPGTCPPQASQDTCTNTRGLVRFGARFRVFRVFRG